jgi:5-methylcytosine-specific restriction endonuclease McrA
MNIEDKLREDLLIAQSRIISLETQIATLLRHDSRKTIKIKTKQYQKLIYAVFDGKCFYCDVKIENKKVPNNEICRCVNKKEPWCIDHLIPRSKGGKNILTNLVLSCIPCDKKKKDKFPNIDDIKRCKLMHQDFQKQKNEAT